MPLLVIPLCISCVGDFPPTPDCGVLRYNEGLDGVGCEGVFNTVCTACLCQGNIRRASMRIVAAELPQQRTQQ